MTDLITEAVRAGCNAKGQGACTYECCGCTVTGHILEVAARHAAEAMRERAAQVVDEANRTGPYNAIGAAAAIRAIPLED